MDTIIAKIQNKDSDEAIYMKAAQILKNGGLVAFPTETVYGLGANALDEMASAKIYAAKRRPSDNPLIVHIADVADLDKLAVDIDDRVKKTIKAFWPGPLTMILKKNQCIPDSITGGLDTVAIRMPSHFVAANLIKKSKIFIAAPSANISGRPSPTRAKHVIEDMNGIIDMIIEHDEVDIGVESTIIDLSVDKPVILRPGYITKAQLEQVLGEVFVDPAIQGNIADGVIPKAPGMKYKHYAPKAKVIIVDGKDNDVIDVINCLTKDKQLEGLKVGIMTCSENMKKYKADVVFDIGSRYDEASNARTLFEALRLFDEKKVDYVYSESFPTNNVGAAVMNRLIKAAGHTILHV